MSASHATATVWHAGEIAMQRAAGVEARMADIGPRVIRDRMPEQHREFLEQLPMLIVGSVDAAGQRPWASMLTELPGFIVTPDDQRVRVNALPESSDPLHAQLSVGATLGLLGIEPETRRRNRVNGRVIAIDATGFELHVEQSFGNCPQYIRPRSAQWVGASIDAPPARREGPRLSTEAVALITQADTMFIASAAPGQGADVSHRGGEPGFVDAVDAEAGTVLTMPDQRGNFFFNTLGNLALHPFAGLLFVDPASGDALQLTGRARVVTAANQRLVRIEVDTGVWTPRASPLRWAA